MDSRFKNIDNELNFKLDKSQLNEFFSEVDTVALDNAFVEASEKMQYPFAPAFWTQFTSVEPEIIQNVHFSEAAKNYSAAYNPTYWTAAEQVLAKEGLNYQYSPTYWAEAEKLLVAADRSIFFRKWLTIASLLLLFGFSGQFLFEKNKFQLQSEDKLAQSKTITEPEELVNTEAITKNNALQAVENETPTSDLLASANNVTPSSVSKPSESQSQLNKTSTTNDSDKQRKGLNETKKTNSISNSNKLLLEAGKADQILHNENTAGKKEGNDLLPTISKIKIAKLTLLTQNTDNPTNNIKEIKVVEKKSKSIPKLFVTMQSGIGNSINNSVKQNLRTAANLGLTIDLQKMKGFSLTVLSGFSHQNLRGYLYSENALNPRRSGQIGQISEAYEFKNLLKWQNGMLLGYQLSKRFNIKLGLSTDILVGSKIKMFELDQDILSITDYKWGRNDFLRNIDYQLINELEYQFKNRLSLIASGAFGFRNQIQPSQYSQKLVPVKNRSFVIGIKYRLF